MVKTREGGKGEDVALHVYNKFQKFVLYKFVFFTNSQDSFRKYLKSINVNF